jgi:hypothetical protein
MARVSSRFWAPIVLLIAGLVAARTSAAQATGYHYVKLWSLDPSALASDVAINDDGDLAVAEANSTGQALYSVPRGGGFKLVDYSNTVFGPATELRLRGLSANETVLYGVDYFPTEPLARAIRQWNRSRVPLEVYAVPTGFAPNLDGFPSQNVGGDVSFFVDFGFDTVVSARLTSAGLGGLEICGSTSHTEIDPSGIVYYDCAAGTSAASREIHRSIGSGSTVFVDDGTFGEGPEGFLPVSARQAGTLLFARGDGHPFGFYEISTGGPSFVAGFDTFEVERSATGQMLFVPLSHPAVEVSASPNPTVVDTATTIAGSAVIGVGSHASLNDRGQVAFVAALADGSAGVYLAAPDACDTDSDGWCDANDDCPAFADASQIDTDGDGVGDRCDNCPFTANADQADSNGDGRGDACAPCNPPGGPLPICGVRSKGAGTDVLTLTFSVASVPLRPGLHGLATSLAANLAADVRVVSCNGGVQSSFPAVTQYGGFGAVGFPLYWTFFHAADRVGATCTVEFRATGAAGSYKYAVEVITAPPVGGLSSYEESNGASVAGKALMPTNIPFYSEATNHRFLYAGTGGSSFGTCSWNPNPPVGDDPGVSYSGASGNGWDCCTFQFDGVDGVPSSVGQLVFNLNGSLPPPDPDGDGFLSPCDSCDYKANVDQKDGGGIGTTTPDLIGDACQCGQLAGNGSVDAVDVTALRNHLAQNPVLTAAQLPFCSVIGGPTECTIRTLTVLRRALAAPGLGPGVAQVCQAALP